MNRVWTSVLVVGSLLCSSLLLVAPATAQEASGAALSGADIRVSPSEEGVNVVQSVRLDNVQQLEEDRIEHIFARPTDPEPQDVRATSEGQEIRIERSDSTDTMSRMSLVLPQEAREEFEYELSYSYADTGDSARVPLIVPTLASEVVESNVSMDLVMPDGEYLQDSFPRLEDGGDGVMQASMAGFPSYSSFTFSESPVTLFNRDNVYTALSIIVILACCIALVLYERRRSRRSSSREVNNV